MKVQAVLDASGTIAVDNSVDMEQTSVAFSKYFDQASGSYAQALDGIFEKASDTYGVSKGLLLSMAKAESNFRSDATSRSGAMGIMQLMPGTASSLGVTDAYDPEQNIMGGAKYIKQLLEKYGGKVSYAVAAYNAGSGNVDKYGGIPPFQETQNYVAKVMQYMEEGVTIPDGLSASKEVETAVQKTDTDQTKQSEAASSLRSWMDKYFDYEDYLRFLKLFTEILYEKLTGESASAQTKAATKTEEDKAEEQAEEAQEQEKQLVMTVRNKGGASFVYHQDEEETESESVSDAYVAYQNMTAGQKNHISIYLSPNSAEV